MKKLLLLLTITTGVGLSSHAQNTQHKVKTTSTVGQKVHNTFSKRKKHDGYKIKNEHKGKTSK
jgi:hypothetical protein